MKFNQKQIRLLIVLLMLGNGHGAEAEQHDLAMKTMDGTVAANGTVMVGDPMNPGNGNSFQKINLFRYNEAFPVVMDLYYNSRTNKWTTNWDVRVEKVVLGSGISGYTYIRLHRPNGQIVHYRNPVVNGTTLTWSGDGDNNAKLTETLNSKGVTTGYTLIRPDNISEYYGNNGMVTFMLDPVGNKLVPRYDGAKRLTQIVSYYSNKTWNITYTYNSTTNTWAQVIKLPSAKTITRIYNNDYSFWPGHQASTTKLTWQDGKSIAFGYDAAKHLTSITDELGNVVASWTYDAQGRATSSQKAGLEQVGITYNADGTSAVTNQDGAASNFGFNIVQGNYKVGSATVAGVPTSYTYDANGNVLTATDGNGVVTTYSYNPSNLETSRVEASGTANARRIDTTWDTNKRVPLTITEYIDGTNATALRTTTMTYDAYGNVLTRAIAVGATTRTWTYTWNGWNQLASIKDPLNHTTTFAYGFRSAGNEGFMLTGVTNALNQTTTFTHNADGQILKMTDPNGVVTSFTYDARGRVLSKVVGGMATTSYGYDAAGQLTTLTLPGGVVLNYSYDAGHRLTQIADAVGNKTLYGYDAMGRRNSVQNKDPAGNLTQTRAYAYDGLGRLIQMSGAATGETTTYTYDNNGNQISVTDPLNQITTRQFDTLNRLAKSIDPMHQTDQVGATFGYDSYSKLSLVTDPKGLVTQYTNDGFGGISQQTSPDTGTTSYTQDAAGNVLTRTDAKGQKTSYTYDALNRVTLATYQDGSTTTYTYDQGANGKGRLTGMVDGTGSYAYTWNPLGNLVTETRTLNGIAYVTGYGYDSAGRLNSITYPSGRDIGYTRDPQGRISQITATLGGTTQTLAGNISYQPFGGLKSMTFGNGGSYTRYYDQDGRITNHGLGTSSRSLGYDNASRITASADYTAAAPGTPVNVQSYGYDGLDRLTNWTAPNSNQSYGYDANGNRVSLTIGATTYNYTYPTTSNQLQSTQGPAPARSYTYDANGSPTGDGTNQYSYDSRGRLVQAVTPLGTVSYGINSYGQRIRKTIGTTTTLYHYDQSGHVIGESDASGTMTAEYVYLDDTPLAVFK